MDFFIRSRTLEGQMLGGIYEHCEKGQTQAEVLESKKFFLDVDEFLRRGSGPPADGSRAV
jgi:hypothetical protein